MLSLDCHTPSLCLVARSTTGSLRISFERQSLKPRAVTELSAEIAILVRQATHSLPNVLGGEAPSSAHP